MTWEVPLLVSYHFAFSYCSWGSWGKNTDVVCHSLLQWATFCLTLHHDPPILGCPAGMAWFHWVRQGCDPSVIRLTSFLWVWFQENALVIANTLFQQHKRRLYTWTSPDSQQRNQIDYILCSQRWRSSIQSTKTRPGADCGSNHELLITKFRLKLKTVGKTARPFRYDLNQIPYDDTVEVRNKFKGLDLIDRVPDELWNEVHDIV